MSDVLSDWAAHRSLDSCLQRNQGCGRRPNLFEWKDAPNCLSPFAAHISLAVAPCATAAFLCSSWRANSETETSSSQLNGLAPADRHRTCPPFYCLPRKDPETRHDLRQYARLNISERRPPSKSVALSSHLVTVCALASPPCGCGSLGAAEGACLGVCMAGASICPLVRAATQDRHTLDAAIY